MSEFRDAIARCYDGPDGPFNVSTANAVLAMPEMQALRSLALAAIPICCDDCAREFIEDRGGTPALIAWVLDEGSNP